MAGILVGYARCSTDKQDLDAQREALTALGVTAGRIYLDKGLTGTSRGHPGLDQALAAVRAWRRPVVPAWTGSRGLSPMPATSVIPPRRPGRPAIGRRDRVRPGDPMSKMFFNMLAVFAEFEVDLLRMRTREGMAIARAKGRLGRQPKLSARQRALLIDLQAKGEHTMAGAGRDVLGVEADRLPGPRRRHRRSHGRPGRRRTAGSITAKEGAA